MSFDKHQNQETSSLALAAYLSVTGISCVTLTQNLPTPQFSFVFDVAQKKFEELSGLFWSKKAQVDPLSYFEALKVLKSRIHQYKYQERSHESNNR